MDSGQAELIINRDHEVNQMEMSIDDQCASILARRQPAASDLRLVVAIIKVNTTWSESATRRLRWLARPCGCRRRVTRRVILSKYAISAPMSPICCVAH